MSNNPSGGIDFSISGIEESRRGLRGLADDLGWVVTKAKDFKEKLEKPVDIAVSKIQDTRGRFTGFAEGNIGGNLQAVESFNMQVASFSSTLSETSPEIAAFSQGIAQAGEAVGTASVALDVLKGAAGPAGVALLALSAALAVFKAASDELKNNQEEYIQELENISSKERRLRESSINATEEYIAAENRRIEFEKKILVTQIQGLEERINKENEALREGLDGTAGVIREGVENTINSYTAGLLELTGVMDDLAFKAQDIVGIDTDKPAEEAEKLKTKLDELNTELEVLNSEELRRIAIINETITGIQSEADLRVQLVRQLDTLTTEQVNQIIRINEEIANIRQGEIVEYLGELAKQAEEFAPAILSLQEGLEQGILTPEYVKKQIDFYLSSGIVEVTPEFERLANEINSTAIELSGLTRETEFYKEEGLKAAEANEEQKKTTEALRKAHEDLSETLKSSTDELNQVNDRIADIQQTLADERVNQNVEDLRDYITETLEAQIEAAKQREAQAELERKAEEARTTALEREVEITTKLRDESAAALAELNAQISALNADYMASELEAVEEFRKQEARINEDYNRDRLRTIEDLNDNLLEAALDNDVKRFIQLQKEGEKQLRREAEDASVEARRRQEDFLKEREQARQQFAQRLADLQAQYVAEAEQRREAANQQLLELRENLNEQLKQIQAGGQKRISESYALEQRLQALRNQWAQQDEYARRQIRVQGLNQELQDLVAHQAQLRQVIAQSYQELIQMINPFSGSSGGSSVPTVPTIPSDPIRLPVNPFGGGSGRGSSRGSTVNVNVESPIVGDVASKQDVADGMAEFAGMVADSVARVYAGVR